MSVKATRCPAICITFLGVLFLFVGIIYFGIKVAECEQSKTVVVASSSSALKSPYWNFGYPLLIAVWSVATGGVGLCASKKRRPPTPPSKTVCKIFVFLKCTLVLIALMGYLAFDFILHFKSSYLKLNGKDCENLNKKLTTNCYVRVSLEGCVLAIDGLVCIFTLWCSVCCLLSLCCDISTVDPEQLHADQGQVQLQPARGGPNITTAATTSQLSAPKATNPAPSSTQPPPSSTHWAAPRIDLPVLPPIGTVIPTAPMIYDPDEDTSPYNPHWHAEHYHIHRNPDGPPPYTPYPETGPVMIDRQNSQVYFAHRGYLNRVE